MPGGCQELGESFKETIIREIKEETNLDVKEEDLELIDIVSGKSRRNSYPNGDVVINNTALYLVKKYSGELIYFCRQDKFQHQGNLQIILHFQALPYLYKNI